MTRVHFVRGVDDDRRAAAVHEAAHVVVGITRGLRVRFATIRPNVVSGRRVIFEPCGATRDAQMELQARLISAVAGPATQRRLCPGTDFRAAGACDFVEASKLCDLLAASPAGARALGGMRQLRRLQL